MVLRIAVVMLLVLLLVMSNGCAWITRPMTGATLRAALDECHENDLGSLVYIRTDNSVMGVRCIPKKDQVTRIIRVRPYVPMKLIRSFSQTEEVVE